MKNANLICGYISEKTGLYSVDFICTNCGKYHEEVTFGTIVKCECGSEINLRLTEKDRVIEI